MYKYYAAAAVMLSRVAIVHSLPTCIYSKEAVQVVVVEV